MHYRLTCDCGATHLVTTSQAGQQLTCSCGNSLSIPTLRELKQLPAADPTYEPQRRAIDGPDRRRPSLLIGSMFAVMCLAIPAAIFFTYQRLTMDTSYTEESDREMAFAELDEATPAELSMAWDSFSTRGLGQPTKPAFYQVQSQARALQWRLAIAWGIALIAAIIAAAVAVNRRERQRL